MIRKYQDEDYNAVLSLVNEGLFTVETSELEEELRLASRKYVWDDQGICGLIFAGVRHNHEKDLYTNFYVALEKRSKGIGKKLFDFAISKFQDHEYTQIKSEWIIDKNTPEVFYKNLGFEKYFGCIEMHHQGSLEQLELQMKQYEERYYDEIATCRSEAFYDLRKDGDFKPYYIEHSEEDKAYFTSVKDKTYILLDQGEILGYSILNPPYIDAIAVHPKYWGKGIGDQIVKEVIMRNNLAKRQALRLLLVEGNDKAEKLYLSNGFVAVRMTHVVRYKK